MSNDPKAEALGLKPNQNYVEKFKNNPIKLCNFAFHSVRIYIGAVGLASEYNICLRRAYRTGVEIIHLLRLKASVQSVSLWGGAA